jgi:biopolymer transport protein ExbD
MKIGSPHPHRRARIEIIPLIDIMFFLLASFMLASLSMIKLQSVNVTLPSAVTAKRDFTPDILNIGVDKAGLAYIEKTQVDLAQLSSYLSNRFLIRSNSPVYITADTDTKHGAITRVLQVVYAAGVRKVSFSIAASKAPSQSQ